MKAMLNKLFPLSYRCKSSKEMLLSLLCYLAMMVIGGLVRGTTAYFDFFPAAGGMIALLASIYTFGGIALLTAHYLTKTK